MISPKIYLTTAISYVNAKPHIGHAYEEIATDVMARWKRLNGYEVFFATGSDEHSANIDTRARETNQSPQSYCDEMVDLFKAAWKELNISYDRFIRTSEPGHHRAAQEMVRRAKAAGDIYKGRYEGWYCNACENYYLESDLKNGLCPVHGIPANWLAEENYFFRLARFEKPLLEYIDANPGFIQPETRRKEVINILKSGLRDISISRSRASHSWGIPFPEDPEHVIYVWFDALINYISAIGFPDEPAMFQKYWPAEVHVVGKDIIRFHCIIWPAMLMSAGLSLPRKVFGHGFILLKGEKISKTRGNVLDPLDMVRTYGEDAFRYVLMASNNFSGDSDFSEAAMVERFNSDLANDLGNLLNRTLTMVEKYCEGQVPAASGRGSNLDQEFTQMGQSLFLPFDGLLTKFKFAEALNLLWDMIKRGNKYIELSTPWALFKQERKEDLNRVMYNLLESLRLAAVYLQAFMPRTTPRILAQLGDPQPEQPRMFPQAAQWGLLPPGQKIAKGAPLFPRLEKDQEAA